MEQKGLIVQSCLEANMQAGDEGFILRGPCWK